MQELLVGAMICAIALGIGFFAGSAYRGTQLRKAGEDFPDLIAVADAGLYHAKENGRNRVSASRPVEPRPE